jgi:signal transduction histidine kinase
LFFGFFTNYWKVADQQWFVSHQRDMESHIVGRMVKSRQDGIFSDGGLTGVGNEEAIFVNDYPFDFQYLAYTNNLLFGSYKTYDSQIGGQGMFFSILDKIIPLPPHEKLHIFHIFTSLLSALSLTAIILWFYWEFGLFASLFVLASVVFSQWLVVFGRNLWWSMWAFYLPMVVVMHYLRLNKAPTNSQSIKFGTLVFITVFTKCLFNGYEYITTTLIMMMVPFVYYSILNRLSFRRFCRDLITKTFSTCLAILITLGILFFQIASVKGDFLKGVDHIVYVLRKRTHADYHDFPSMSAYSLKSSTSTVVIKYLKGTFFDLNNYLSTSNSFVSRLLFKIRYLYLIFLFLLMSVFLYYRRNKNVSEKGQQSILALIFATWFSILAPLSWFIVFKSHSFIHTHMNFIVWQMPFTFFGFAVCGLVAENAFSDLIRLTRRNT